MPIGAGLDRMAEAGHSASSRVSSLAVLSIFASLQKETVLLPCGLYQAVMQVQVTVSVCVWVFVC